MRAVNKIILFLIIFLGNIFFIPIYSYADLTSGLLVWWRFNEGTGTSTTADSSGNSNSGSLFNSPTWVTGKIGNALNFNGSSQYVYSSSLGSPPQSITLAAWINSGAAGGVVFTEQGQVTLNGGWHDVQIEVETNGTVKACIWTGGLSCVNATASLGFNQWHQVVMTYDVGTTTLTGYYDGVAGGSNSALTKQYPGVLYYAIGAVDGTSPGNGVYFSGSIDDVRIYNRALSATEVAQLYRVGPRVFKNVHIGKMKLHE